MKQPTHQEIAISLKRCSLSFNSVPVLNNVSLDIYKNEFVSILGPSGCGKSSLLRIMLELLRPQMKVEKSSITMRSLPLALCFRSPFSCHG